MKKIVLLIVFNLIAYLSFSQKVDLKYSKVIVCYKDTIELKTNSKLNFDKFNFMLQSDDERLYSFIVPNSEFDAMNFRMFRDTGMLLKDDKDTTTRTVVYESLFSFPNPIQIGIKLSKNLTDSLTIIKRDKSSIIFIK
jgi:hypothetical protein